MKTLRKVEIKRVEYSEFLPEQENMEEQVVYISEIYGGSSHKCLCGCGQLIYISIDKALHSWNLIKHDDGKISFTPSLQHLLGCKSHYIITKNIANFV